MNGVHMDDRPAAGHLARALRELKAKAGDPSYDTIAAWGRRQDPAVNLSKSKLSPWFNGISVPADGRPFTVLVELLEARALRKSGTPKRGVPAWRAMRDAADQERRRAASAPGAIPSARGGDEAPSPAAADADKAGRLLRLLPPDGLWQSWLRKAETMFRVPLDVSNAVCDALPALEDDQFKYIDPELQAAHEAMMEGLRALCFELNGMTDISDEGPQVLEISHPGTAEGRNDLNRQACTARDLLLSAYWQLVNLLNGRGIASPKDASGPPPESGAGQLDITVQLQAGYTVAHGGVALFPIEVADQVRSEAFSGPYFLAVRAANPGPIGVQIAAVGIDIDCGGQVQLPWLFPQRGPGGEQLPFDLGSHAGGQAVAYAVGLGHNFLAVAKRGGTPRRVRAFARVGSGGLFYGSWIPAADLLPFLTTAFSE
ncbi:hypothetical protein [Streptomyces sp. NBC_00280]|uniref:hypothetical protein n=1 Tax=Streptomyces sp. NBC_00280 TaxID=2975699 RepID=UPI0032435221